MATLTGIDGSSFSVTPTAYWLDPTTRKSSSPPDKYALNWLLIAIELHSGGERWSSTPELGSLLTWELRDLPGWLRTVAAASIPVGHEWSGLESDFVLAVLEVEPVVSLLASLGYATLPRHLLDVIEPPEAVIRAPRAAILQFADAIEEEARHFLERTPPKPPATQP